jgi:DeoR family transcriptional regulator of aga operon
MLNRKMVENAGMIIAITDSSKFGKVCLHRIMTVAELDTMITDRDAPEEITQAIQQLGVDLQLA